MQCSLSDISKMLQIMPRSIRSFQIATGLSKQIWVLLDQCLVSLGTFATMLIVARLLSPQRYGEISVIITLSYLLISAHAAAIIYPVMIVASCSSELRTRRFISSAVAITAAGAVIEAAIVFPVLTILGHAALGYVTTASVSASHLQEITRRALICRSRYRGALIGDGISYVGQAIATGLLAHFHVKTVGPILLVMFLTSVAALCIQAVQLRMPFPSWRRIAIDLRSICGMSRWSFVSFIANYPSTQGYAWLITLAYGATAMAYVQAVRSPVGLAHPVMFAVGSLVVSSVSRSHHSDRCPKLAILAGVRSVLLAPSLSAAISPFSSLFRESCSIRCTALIRHTSV